MYKEILITRDDREGRAAVLEDGTLSEFLIAREERQVGSIYKGRVANVLPGMNAAFVDVGLERNAFLCADDAAAHLGEDASASLKKHDIRDILKVNEEAMVQVVKEAVGTKGARVTTFVTLPGRYLVLIPAASYVGVSRRVEDDSERGRLRQIAEKIQPDGMGIIVRTSSCGRSQDELKREVDFLARSWQRIQRNAKRRKAPACVHQELALIDKILRDVLTPDVNRLIIDNGEEHAKILERLEATAPALAERVFLYEDPTPLFEFHGIDQEIEKALDRKVWLESGGYLIIDRTEALWVIDVNTGKYTGKTSLADTILKTNLEAMREICRQLRLRDIGGIIIIDFIDMESASDRRRLMSELVEELKKDRTRTHLVGMTELGLVQLTRKREGKDLDLVLREECPYCNGRGRILSPKTVALRARREILKSAADHSKHEALLVACHPRVGLDLVGLDGEALEALESQTGKIIMVRVDEDFHQEEYKIEAGRRKDLNKRLRPLSKGRKDRVYLEDGFGKDSKSALAVLDGNLVEVISVGDRLGQFADVRVTDTNGVVSRAELVR